MRTVDPKTGEPRTCCDATDPREGRGWGKPCPRRVVVESWRTMSDPAGSYALHFCERHAHRADEAPRPVLEVRNRRL